MTGKLSVSEGGQCGAESPRRGCFPRARKHHNSSADGGEWSRQTTPCPVTSHNQCDPSPPNASVACVNRFKSNAHNTAQESFRLVHDEKAFLSEGAIVLPTIEWNGSMAARERNTRRTSTRDGPTHVPSKHHSLCLQCCPSGSEEPLDGGGLTRPFTSVCTAVVMFSCSREAPASWALSPALTALGHTCVAGNVVPFCLIRALGLPAGTLRSSNVIGQIGQFRVWTGRA